MHDNLGLTVPQNDSSSSGQPELVMEYQVESERGFQLFGSIVFTSNTLLPLDPAHFTSVSGEPLGKSLTDFEVPDESWVWAWSRWYVDMTADVDDQGWCYSWRFGSKHWSGRHRFMRSFVRQRVWKRPRANTKLLANGSPESLASQKDPLNTESAEGKAAQENYDTTEDREKLESMAKAERIIGRINGLRNDRERVAAIIHLIENSTEDSNLLLEIRDQLLGTLHYPVSKRSLVSKLSESTNEKCRLFILAPSNAWRDQTLRRGEPEWEMESENRSMAEKELA